MRIGVVSTLIRLGFAQYPQEPNDTRDNRNVRLCIHLPMRFKLSIISIRLFCSSFRARYRVDPKQIYGNPFYIYMEGLNLTLNLANHRQILRIINSR